MLKVVLYVILTCILLNDLAPTLRELSRILDKLSNLLKEIVKLFK